MIRLFSYEHCELLLGHQDKGKIFDIDEVDTLGSLALI